MTHQAAALAAILPLAQAYADALARDAGRRPTADETRARLALDYALAVAAGDGPDVVAERFTAYRAACVPPRAARIVPPGRSDAVRAVLDYLNRRHADAPP